MVCNDLLVFENIVGYAVMCEEHLNQRLTLLTSREVNLSYIYLQ